MRFILFAALAAFLVLAGCGQSGPLYLPPGVQTPPPVTVPAPLTPGAQTPTTENPVGTGKDAITR